jgi:hypothetical protein
MSKLFSRLGGIAAAAAIGLAVTAGAAAANVTRYHPSNGDVVTITTPDVSAPVNGQAQFPVTVSVDGPAPVLAAWEKFLTPSGPDWQSGDGLSFGSYGCSGSLAPGHSCTSTVKFTPMFLGSRTEHYVLETGVGTMYGAFTATGLRARVIPPVPSPTPPPAH